MLSKED
jgi:hypothetical protein